MHRSLSMEARISDLTKHIRRPDLGPVSGKWHTACDCGWSASVPLLSTDGKTMNKPLIEAQLEKVFVEHLPADQRRLYLLIDQRPGHEAVWVMPLGEPAILESHGEEKGVRFGFINTGEEFPIGEIRTAEGQIFRIE